MDTHKGYVVPVILILILLLLAGIFTFTAEKDEVPVLLQDVPTRASSTPVIAEPDEDDATTTEEFDDSDNEFSTSTIDASLESELETEE